MILGHASRAEDRDAVAFASRRPQASQFVDRFPQVHDRIGHDVYDSLLIAKADEAGGVG
jgi:hypothetical protein